VQMPTTCRSSAPIVAVVATAVWLSLPALGRAEETVPLKNGMKAPITVLLKAEQQDSPTEVRILTDDTYDFPLGHAGPYKIQVIPDDQRNKGYNLGVVDLRLRARATGGQPIGLKGEFVELVDAFGRVVSKERTAVFFDTTHPSGLVIRTSANRTDYVQELAGSYADGEEPRPTATTAVIAAYVPPGATVTVDGSATVSTGRLRFFEGRIPVPGRTYYYMVTAVWTKDGHVCKVTKKVPVRAGETTPVHFQMPIDDPPPVVVFPAAGVVPVPAPVPAPAPSPPSR